jgi:putative nucleotidyltransferase with HDIG domain
MEAVMVSRRRALEMKRMEAELEEYRRRIESTVEQRTKQPKVAMQRIGFTYDETLEVLAGALDVRDNATAGHSRRVTLYSLEMARRLNFSGDQLEHLERGAYLHDIGKMGIPDSILLKPGNLTPEETAVMQTHVRIGYELASRVAFLAPAAQIVLAHHERYDGTGYPQGLRGEEIPLGARIFAVADTFDAILSDRPYRRGRLYSVARTEIACESGKQFDPLVVAEFLKVPDQVWGAILSKAARKPSPQSPTSSAYFPLRHIALKMP